MKHNELTPDEAIGRVLGGLREAKPLDGMQQRVLHGARERAGARTFSRLRPLAGETRLWAVAASCVAAIALAASWMVMHHSYRTVHEAAHGPAHLRPPNAPPTDRHFATARAERLQSTPGPKSVSAARSSAPAEPVSDEDALAISEMLAPSKPAPPLPLTHQERLLAEVVHHGAPEELASLRPDVRAREIEIAKAEFHDFFEPASLNRPPVNDSE